MNDSFNPYIANEEFNNDNRSDHDEEYMLNLRVKMDKKVLDEFIGFFPKMQDGNLPTAVKWFLGGKLEFAMYLSNSATNEHPNSINLVLASDSENKHNIDLLEELGSMTLSVFGFNSSDWFYITKIKKVPRPVGSVSNRVIKSNIIFFYNPDPVAENMPQRLLNRIFELPNILEETKNINQRISHWDEYLKINEQIAEESQLLVSYNGYFKSQYISQLVFVAKAGEFNSAHVNSDIQLVTETEYENGHPVYKGPIIGTVNSYNDDNEELTVDLDFDFKEMLDEERYEIPKSGKLFISKWGDLVQIRRLRYGLQCFARGQAANPYLDVFLFDSSKARMPYFPGETLHTGNLLQPNLNPEQKRAVEGVINSDDLYLIQGPPGTGKTTVIAEICYQNAIRGQKTLIASQTNLAVDNALGKLIHHPKIRALRKGNEQSVQEEGKLFTENNVIATWLHKTADDCTVQLSPRKNNLQKAIDAEDKLEFIQSQFELFNESTKSRNTYGIEKANLDNQCQKFRKRMEWLEHNMPVFLEFTDEMSVKNLIANPYDADDDFIEEIAVYYKTKYELTEKRAKYKNAIDEIRNFMMTYQDKADELYAELKKNDKNGEYKLTDENNLTAEDMSFVKWQSKSGSIISELESAISKKPGSVSRIIGMNKSWLKNTAICLDRFNEFKVSSARVLIKQRENLKEIIDTNPLPQMAEMLRQRADEIKEKWLPELQRLEKELENVEQKLEESKQAILSSREEINNFNSDLPYGAKAEAIEIVCRKDNIAEYYKNLWKTKKDDDAKITDLQEGWINRLNDRKEKDYKDFKQLYIDNANVIGITCSQSGSKEFTSLYPTFDVAIIDEVSKATPPELILSVLKAKKIVLVGDHKQLPPMIGSDTYEEVAKKLNISPESAEHMKLSLFEELFVKAPPEMKTMLSTQYRMHNHIMDCINQFYIEENGYGLKCGLPDPDNMRKHNCHGKAIGENEHSLWVDVPLFEENHETRSSVNHSYSNKAECKCIKDILLTLNDNLTANGFEGKKRIGIISFYSNQVRMMENEFFDREFAKRIDKLSLRIGSVDRFQGIECPVVICSFVRNNTRGEIGFAKDPRRVNVALSRAQELSVIVGCTELFCYSNNSPEASSIYKTITQNIFKAGGERSAWDFE